MPDGYDLNTWESAGIIRKDKPKKHYIKLNKRTRDFYSDMAKQTHHGMLQRMIAYNIDEIEIKKHGIYEGELGKLQVDKKIGTTDTYIITEFNHPKPTFKIGNKTFIVS